MPAAKKDDVDHQVMCWNASANATGTEAALWAIAASLCKLASATERSAENFGPDADVAAPTRAVETLAAAVDNIAVALENPLSISQDQHRQSN